MSVLGPVAASGAPATAAAGAPRRRRLLGWLLVAALGLAAVAVAWVTAGDEPGRTARLDPANAGPDGARAVARVLDDQGVEVDVVRTADELAATGAGAGTTVVVTSSAQLGESTVDRLRDDARGADLVVVDPGPALLDLLSLPGGTGALDTDGPLAAACEDPRFEGLEVSVDRADAMPLPGCFSDALATDGDLTLLGAGDLLTNDQVLRGDNAAVALRLLGPHDRVVWYVATYDDLRADDGVGLGSLLPDWLVPALWLLGVSTVLLVLWRGRRLGPLATEPLPVTVKAVETTLSRGRLYRRAGDRAHAAATLRAAARRRLAGRLRLGARPDEALLVRAVAQHSGVPEPEVAALLGSGAAAPPTDHDLVALAGDLERLTREVRRP